MTDKDLLTEVNVTELLKIAKQSDIQYNAVVKQNRELQAELREVQNENFILKDAFGLYKKDKEVLEDIKIIAEMAIKGMYATKSDDYTDGMKTIGSYVLNKLNEVFNG